MSRQLLFCSVVSILVVVASSMVVLSSGGMQRQVENLKWEHKYVKLSEFEFSYLVNTFPSPPQTTPLFCECDHPAELMKTVTMSVNSNWSFTMVVHDVFSKLGKFSRTSCSNHVKMFFFLTDNHSRFSVFELESNLFQMVLPKEATCRFLHDCRWPVTVSHFEYFDKFEFSSKWSENFQWTFPEFLTRCWR